MCLTFEGAFVGCISIQCISGQYLVEPPSATAASLLGDVSADFAHLDLDIFDQIS